MLNRYENWKSLKPLTEPAPIGAQCVCLVDDFCFKAGDVVQAEFLDYLPCTSFSGAYFCKSDAGGIIMFGNELSLLPANG